MSSNVWSPAVCGCRWSDGHGEGADGHTKCLLSMRVCMSSCMSQCGHACANDSAVCSSSHTSRCGHAHADDGVRCDVDLNTTATVQQARHIMVMVMLSSI